MDYFRLLLARNRMSDIRRKTLARLESSPVRLGLSFKLLVIIVGVSLVGVLVSSAIGLTLHHRQLIDNAELSTDHLSNVIQAGLEHAMLQNDRETTRQIVAALTGSGGIEHVRVLDSRGIVQVSSVPEEVQTVIDYTQPSCQFCHAGGQRPSNKTAIVTAQDNHQALVNVNLIQNRAQCQGCHDARTRVLGLLIVETSLDDLNRQLMEGTLQVAGSALAMMVLLVALMFVALRVLVFRPVGRLARGMTEIRAGNLDYPVRMTSKDELGDLAQTFDVMRRELKTTRVEMEERTQQLATLNDLALGASQLFEVQEILELALDTVVGRLGMAAGGIYLRDPNSGEFTLHALRGISEAQLTDVVSAVQQAGAASLSDGDKVSVIPIGTDGRLQGWWDESQERQYVNVSLVSKKVTVGTLTLVTRSGQVVTEREKTVLKAVGHQVAIAIDNAVLLAETRRREQEALTLYRLMTRISSSLEMDQVLMAIADGARHGLGADIGAVGLIDELGYQISVKACSGCHTDLVKGMLIPARNLIPLTGSAAMKAICIEEWKPDLPLPRVGELIEREGIVSSLAVPMWSKGRLYGFIGVMTRQRRRFTAQDTQLFLRLALQVVVAIENAELYKQVRYMATLEERDRLAREMHDNLAQMLGFINIKASLTDDLLAKSQIAQARANLLELKGIAKEAYTDVRDSIFSLRTAVSNEYSLVSTLQDYVSEFRTHYGIDAQLYVQDEETTRFPAEVEIQVNRIIQEALTNVRKHSGASRAWVRFERVDHHVRISIEDNGHGFEPAKKSGDGARHFGLEIMRERAASAGGELDIHSHLNSGTRIVVRLPIMPAGEGM